MNTKTQRSRILQTLRNYRSSRLNDGWAPLPVIMSANGTQIAQYNARIWELRDEGHEIDNKTETINGVRHSWFRLAKDADLV